MLQKLQITVAEELIKNYKFQGFQLIRELQLAQSCQVAAQLSDLLCSGCQWSDSQVACV